MDETIIHHFIKTKTMAIILQRQITNEEKGQILAKFGRICYATGHQIPESDEIHFDRNAG
ncbi:hypothetical protein [Anaerorudis cellulosivorans]|uniref:hypothetical protein n=1 Tax=Anaerorudis cellulosivorans TaxID=3397862 RepID=UPI00221FB9B4|nr:hypothetical protein [Seramator thermalis]MCW1734283.1 hypothetical protein [Seramator thermalis]